MNKHFVILPDGQRATRNSKNRVYTHAVAVRQSYAYALQEAQSHGNLDVHRSNWRYAKEKAEQGAAHRHAAYQTPERQAEDERVAALSLAEYRAELTAKAIARVEQLKAEGYYDKWFVAGWNGRADLAQKLHQSEANRLYNAEVITLEAQRA